MIRRFERLVGRESGLRPLVVGYAVAGVAQGLVIASLIPILRFLMASDVAAAVPWIVVAAIAALVSGISTWVTTNAAYFAGVEGMAGTLMHAIGDHITRLPLGWFKASTPGRVAQIMSTSVQNLMTVPNIVIQQMALAITTPLTVIVATFFVDWRLALSFLVLVPVGVGVYRWMQRVSAVSDTDVETAESEVSARVLEFSQAQPVLRASGRPVDDWPGLDTALDRDRDATLESLRRRQRPLTAFAAVVSVGFALVFVVAVALAIDTQISATDLIAILIMAVRFVEPVSSLAAYGTGITLARTGLNTISELLETPPAPETEHPLEPANASVEFVDVSFAYDSIPVLRDITLTCAPRTMTALVGPSGAGKTTMARLVARAWDVSAGAVRIGGVDVRDMAPDVLMAQIAMVFQHVYLFDGTIAENIRIGRPDASDEEVEAAASMAGLDEVLERLPRGWESPVGEGGTALSGGERQRVSLARALLKDAPIVLFDEATAALDAENERAVNEVLAALARERTVIVIAHQLSTVAAADQIAVMTEGRIVDAGPHSQLVTSSHLYRQFWAEREQAEGWQLTHSRPPTAGA